MANAKKSSVSYDSYFVTVVVVVVLSLCFVPIFGVKQEQKLRFGRNGEFKILQVADMHYANGKTTPCRDVLPSQNATCSDLNTTAFLNRMILAEKPNLIVFTGDNIYAADAIDPAKSLNAAFAPATASNIPWVAVLGNHDQESTLSREELMKHIVTLNNTLSQVNPPEARIIDGFGNCNLEIGGVKGSGFENKSVLNLYFLDSGDYSKVESVPGYDWIKPSQQLWFQQTSAKLQKEYMRKPAAQQKPAPGLAYFHIPLPEYASLDSTNFTGVKQEETGISSAPVNSGFFSTLLTAGDVKAVFTGHDHINDFCGKVMGIQLCYAGGFGYHAYGKAGWDRRARVVVATLERTQNGDWGAVNSIKTWKRLDDGHLTAIDAQVLWSKQQIPVKNMNRVGQWTPVALLVVVNFALATVNVLFKKSLDQGINKLIIVTYRQMISAVLLAPIAFFWERNSRHKLTAEILCQLFFNALIGITLAQYTFLIGLKYTSATLSCAFINLVSVSTFLLALPFGLEKVDTRSWSGRTKVLGTLICIGGALLLSLYKGNPLINPHVSATNQITNPNNTMVLTKKTQKWTVGSIVLFAGSVLWSSWFLMQARIGKRYPCQYSSTALLSVFGAIQSAILSLIIDRNLSSWVLKGELEIITVVYAGIVGSALCYVGMSWCVKQRGPVFTSAFTPLIQIFVAMFDFSLLREPIYLGSVLGSVLVISGMYILLWGKSREIDEAKMKQAQVALQRQDEEHRNGVSHVIPITSNSTTSP